MLPERTVRFPAVAASRADAASESDVTEDIIAFIRLLPRNVKFMVSVEMPSSETKTAAVCQAAALLRAKLERHGGGHVSIVEKSRI